MLNEVITTALLVALQETNSRISRGIANGTISIRDFFIKVKDFTIAIVDSIKKCIKKD